DLATPCDPGAGRSDRRHGFLGHLRDPAVPLWDPLRRLRVPSLPERAWSRFSPQLCRLETFPRADSEMRQSDRLPVPARGHLWRLAGRGAYAKAAQMEPGKDPNDRRAAGNPG